MPSSKSLFLILLLSGNLSPPSQHLLIPESAKITIGAPGRDEKDVESEACKNFRLTPAQVKARLRTYHVLTPVEFHDNYLFSPCWVDGELTVAGKTYTWRARPGNTLATTYPNGVSKMLGGKPSDNPSGK